MHKIYLGLLFRKKSIRTEFLGYDQDNTGHVTIEEAVEVLTKKSGGNIKEDDLRKMIGHYDMDKDGRIDYEEFTYFYSAMGYR